MTAPLDQDRRATCTIAAGERVGVGVQMAFTNDGAHGVEQAQLFPERAHGVTWPAMRRVVMPATSPGGKK